MFTIRSNAPIALLLLAPPGLADSIDLRVTGRVIPSPCVVTFSQQGKIDFGMIEAGALNQHIGTPLRARQIDLRIDCAQLSGVALKISDGRASSMIAGLVGPSTSDQEAFGLGLSRQARIGNYYVRMPREGLYVDGRKAELLYSADGNKSWRRTGPAGELRRDRSFSWTWPETRLPSHFKNLRGTLSVTPYIARAIDLPLEHEIDLDGQASLELQYF